MITREESLRHAKNLGELFLNDIAEAKARGATPASIGAAFGASMEAWLKTLPAPERVFIWTEWAKTMNGDLL